MFQFGNMEDMKLLMATINKMQMVIGLLTQMPAHGSNQLW